VIHASVHEPEIIISYLKAREEVIVSNIMPGDYVFPPTGIERKTYEDFLYSVKTRRLFEQMQRLKSCYADTYLIIEAPYLMNIFSSTHSFARPTYRIILYLMEREIKVLFSSSPEHTAEIILLIHKRTKRAFPQLTNKPARYRPKKQTLREQQLFFLQGIPSIGLKTAKKIMKSCPSIRDFLDAEPSDLKKVLGAKKRKQMNALLKAKFYEQ
jgi:DNA excision repair protein ERCC-4